MTLFRSNQRLVRRTLLQKLSSRFAMRVPFQRLKSELRSMCAVGLLFLLWSFANAVHAQPNDPVEVLLRIHTRQVHLNDMMSLNVVLRNADAHRKVVLRGRPGFGAGGGVNFVIIDGQGNRRNLPPTSGGPTLEEVRKGTKHILLAPNEAVVLNRHEKVSLLFPTPGRYQVQVTYSSPLPSEQVRAVPAALEGARGTSNTIEIEVQD